MKIVFILLYGLIGIVTSYFLVLLFFSLLVSPRKEYNKDSRLYRFLLHTASVIVLRLMRVKVYVHGKEKLPSDQKLLFVCNHRSNFDPIITWYIFRDHKLAFISKKENFKLPIFGRIIRKCCFMAIDRESPKKAIATINRASKLLESQEVSIGVYPEGKRSKDGVLSKFHSGVFRIAQKAHAPLAILSINGTEKIHKNYPFRSSRVDISVVDVISTEQTCSTRTNDLCNISKKMIENNLKQKLDNKDSK